MKEERVEILRMVADGTITAEEGARLLEALAVSCEGEERHRKRKEKRIELNFDGLGDVFSGIGSTLKTVVSDVIADAFENEYEGEGYEKIELVEESFPLPKGSTLRIKGRKGGCAGGGALGDLRLEPGEEGICRIRSGGDCTVWKKGDRFLIRWGGGPLEAALPPDLASLHVSSAGGGIAGTLVPMEELQIKSMGGEVSLEEIACSFRIKTMGGRLSLRKVSLYKGRGRATSMGGDIVLTIAEGFSGEIEASTLGGEIAVDCCFEHPKVFRGIAKKKVILATGEGGAKISLKSMGGNIEVGRS